MAESGGCSGCQSGCSGGCSGSCSGSCSGGCYGGCKGTCSGKCTGSCQTECENVCANACQTICQNGGQTVATNKNTDAFYWSSTIEQGKTILISAIEWNDLATKTENNASYCTNENCSIIRVQPKDPITDRVFNSMKNGISKLNTVNIADKKKDIDLIEAEDFLVLNSKMNSAQLIDNSCCQLGEYCVQHCNQSSGTQVGH